MGSFNIWLFFIGAIVTCRALSFAAIQWEMYTLRDGMCIKRIVEEQKVCDLLVAIYHTLVSVTGIWFMILGGWNVFTEVYAPNSITIIASVILAVLFMGYFGLRWYFYEGYDLDEFYNDMVAYRKKQAVVTDDNDNEVSFIRTYIRVKKHKWYALIWVGLIVGVTGYYMCLA